MDNPAKANPKTVKKTLDAIHEQSRDVADTAHEVHRATAHVESSADRTTRLAVEVQDLSGWTTRQRLTCGARSGPFAVQCVDGRSS
jgi:hypothetical protein